MQKPIWWLWGVTVFFTGCSLMPEPVTYYSQSLFADRSSDYAYVKHEAIATPEWSPFYNYEYVGTTVYGANANSTKVNELFKTQSDSILLKYYSELGQFVIYEDTNNFGFEYHTSYWYKFDLSTKKKTLIATRAYGDTNSFCYNVAVIPSPDGQVIAKVEERSSSDICSEEARSVDVTFLDAVTLEPIGVVKQSPDSEQTGNFVTGYHWHTADLFWVDLNLGAEGYNRFGDSIEVEDKTCHSFDFNSRLVNEQGYRLYGNALEGYFEPRFVGFLYGQGCALH